MTNFNPVPPAEHIAAALRVIETHDDKGCDEAIIRRETGLNGSLDQVIWHARQLGYIAAWRASKWYSGTWKITDAGRGWLANYERENTTMEGRKIHISELTIEQAQSDLYDAWKVYYQMGERYASYPRLFTATLPLCCQRIFEASERLAQVEQRESKHQVDAQLDTLREMNAELIRDNNELHTALEQRNEDDEDAKEVRAGYQALRDLLDEAGMMNEKGLPAKIRRLIEERDSYRAQISAQPENIPGAAELFATLPDGPNARASFELSLKYLLHFWALASDNERAKLLPKVTDLLLTAWWKRGTDWIGVVRKVRAAEIAIGLTPQDMGRTGQSGRAASVPFGQKPAA